MQGERPGEGRGQTVRLLHANNESKNLKREGNTADG